MSVVGFQVVPASVVQRSPTEYGVSECDREASIMGWHWRTSGDVAPPGGGYKLPVLPIT